ALRLRLPGGARDRLQHLPDDPGTGGDAAPRTAPGCPSWTHRDGGCHHVSRRGPRRDVLHARRAAAGGPRRTRCRGGARGADRHRGGPRVAGARPHVRHRPPDVVAFAWKGPFLTFNAVKGSLPNTSALAVVGALEVAGPQEAGVRGRHGPHPLAFIELKQDSARSEEHTSELQSRENLVCRLLLEKKKDQTCSNL